MNHRESAIQRAVVNGLRMVLGKYFLIAHVPNHGFTNAGILTSMGMIPGAADIVITGARFSAWMEIKDEGKEQSDKQVCFEADCKSRGINYAVVRSLDEAIAACVAWCIATRSKDGSVHSLRPSGLGSVERGADLSQRTGADLAGAVSEASEASTGVTPSSTEAAAAKQPWPTGQGSASLSTSSNPASLRSHEGAKPASEAMTLAEDVQRAAASVEEGSKS